jgi:type I restriction enzyme M protein
MSQTLRDRFLAVLEQLGGSAGNGRLLAELGWKDEIYHTVRGELFNEGLLLAGRGRGGSVSLAGYENVEAAPEALLPPRRTRLAMANGNGANLGFEADLFKAADKLRGNMEPSDYKHVALGLIFLKHISDSFEAKRAALLPEDFTVPEETKIKLSISAEI